MSLVSIIVPIYNVEKYLRRCLDSLVSQTYQNIEIICVNDGSTDNSQLIIEEYKCKFPDRIKSIMKLNGGLGDARNAGLLEAKGEYVLFIDSDDWIEKNTVEILIENALKNQSDIVICGLRRITEENRILSQEQCKLDKEYNNKDALINLAPAAWNKLYKRNLFVDNNIMYPVNVWYEDLPTTSKLFMCSQKITTTNAVLINYLQRNNSIIYSYDSRARDIFKVLEEIKSFNFQKSNIYRDEIEYLFIIHIIFAHLFRSTILDNQSLKKEIKYCKDFIEEKYPKYYKNKYLDIRYKNNNSLLKKIIMNIGILAFKWNIYFPLLQAYKFINHKIPIQFKW
ncbi:glycosyltransferase [Turicibacter sanguinis]|uniref:glycosyltransferase family 2 protein n=1 Tax=Turicibacter sanguinis TaxID=154288 RepID=UPI0012BBFACB|nr:glycosyltransferase family 2 protein [Turicibacter sanguinis]MCU7203349.1 glycosyltransferase family 2 protein [Turicibacter sanguinis]MTN46357.1 glycosyltransferase [Turicibacter sanguinis]MTN52184.1 glycosyltransferase [Turicibacter sanguinis]MTN55225.1 glycosyltransferase [Turicibacter sanguinis]MTN58447.1 glycosyltransferase [Turicibacter sanguinis]